MSAENVANSATFRTSRSVVPSTSKLPLASILPENVANSATFKTSRSVCPSTSRFTFTVRSLVAVISLAVTSSPIVAPPPALKLGAKSVPPTYK